MSEHEFDRKHGIKDKQNDQMPDPKQAPLMDKIERKTVTY